MKKHVFWTAAALVLGVWSAQAQVAFELKEIVTSPSRYLDTAKVHDITQNYTNRPIDFSELEKMVAALQGLYAEAGVPTADVILPPQDIVDGVLKVDLVEAVVERIDIVGNDHTKPEFYHENISLRAGEKPDFDQLERDLIILANSHALQPTIDFRPGDRDLGTIVTVKTNEPANLQYSLGLDTYGREETGTERLHLGAHWGSLTGWRDRLSFGATVSEGAWSLAVNYDRPVGWQGGRLLVGAYATNSQVVGGNFDAAQVVSDGKGVSLSYRLPWYLEHDRSLFASVGATHDATQSTIEGIQFVDTKLTEATLELNWQRSLPLTEIGATGRLRVGSATSAGDALTDGAYSVVQWRLWGNRLLSPDWRVDAALDGQVANKRHIPVARQFGVGGTGILRGYPTDVRSAPDAVAFQMQLTKVSPWYLYDDRIAVQPYVFADAAVLATSAVNGPRTTEADRLFSVGLGANISLDDSYSLNVLLGVPLRDTIGFEESGSPVFLAGFNAVF